MDSKKPSGNEIRVRHTALVVALGLTAIWSGSAMASTQPVTECSDAERLQGLIVSAESPALQPFGHIPVTDVSELKSNNSDKGSRETITSFLNLEPSGNDVIETILKDDETAREEGTAIDIPIAPVADSDDIPDLSELPDSGVPTGAEDEESDMPLLERQMYRIDI